VGVALLAAEVALRIAGFQYPVLYEPDPHTGAWHRPGASGRWRAEGDAWVSISSAGLRDVEHAEGPRPDVLRVAILGDSYAEALQVEREESFWNVMALHLADCATLGEHPVEPINFGVSGFGTVQELVVLRERAWRYAPDFVVLLFVPNDVRNNSRELEGDPMRPYARLVDGRLELDRSFLESDAYRYATSRYPSFRSAATSRSRVVQLIDETRRLRRRAAARAEGRNSQDLVYGPPRDAAWSGAWKVTEAALAQIAREVQGRGARFLLAVGTFGPQVHPDPEVRRRYRAETEVTDFLYPERRLTALGSREGFQVLALAEPMRAAAEASGRCLHGFDNAKPCGGHWNVEGHRLAGELIAGSVCKAPEAPAGKRLARAVSGLPEPAILGSRRRTSLR
jgi:hypothetical protein